MNTASPCPLCPVVIDVVALQFRARPATALLTAIRKFGVLQQTNTYNADGTLASKADGASHTTYFSNYKRGLPQSVAYPNGSSESAVVNDIGLITSVTGASSYTTGYAYDAIGRLASITPPSGWVGTNLLFESVPYDEYGLGAGHWRQTISHGSARSISYFDAFWRPLMKRSFDAANESGTRKVMLSSFDAAGNLAYESYPQRDATSVSSQPAGRHISHDALGRAMLSQADSELGLLSTRVDYLNGFLTQTTNPRGKITTQSYQAFDNPAEAALTGISAPEGVALSVSRDMFGKPLAITRSGMFGGAGVSVTRSYVYDAAQRLCKTIEPEVGATVQNYDAAGNLAWRAPGQPLPNTASCDQASVPAAAKLSFGYTALNQLSSTGYGDGSPSISRTYTADGLPLTVATSNGSTWTYTHNSLRRLAGETLNYGGVNYGLSWGYDSTGNLSTLTYPNGASLSYSPNALGEPGNVSGYASGINYHPTGAVAGYSLANGVVHSLSLNTRNLPLLNRDAGVMQDRYVFDANGNVASITDEQEGIFNRSLGYDDLDRLTSAYAPNVWGSANYAYDPLDNLRTALVGSRNSTLNYDGTNRLSTVVTNGSATSYGYDALGNLRSKGLQTFTFDIGNRLSSASSGGSYTYDGLGRRVRVQSTDGSTRVQVYGSAGQLLWATSAGGALPASSTAYVYLGGKQIAEVTNGVTQYVHTDALGSPVAHTNASGVVINRGRFEPYGYVAQGTKPGPATSVIGFTGHVQDAETDLVYMQQRYYDPIAGRFLSVDPVTTNSGSGGQFNRYAYAENSPYKYVDPDGRDSVVVGNRVEIRPVDSTVPRVSIPNNVGAVGVSSSSMTFHTYDVRTASSFTNSSAVGAGIARSPTPGPANSPASPGGTRNNAGSIPMNGSSNMVNSFSVASPDPSKFTNITVNYTISGQHGLSEGFVVRSGEIGANGAITLRSYGEGNNWQQAPALKGVWGPMVEKTWDTNQKEIIKNADK